MRLSVLIPSLNGIRYLQPCVESLKNQTNPPEEVIVIDCTPEKAASRLKTFPALSIHYLDQRVGVPQMRSVGVQLATGEVIAMTEDHCVADPKWCETMRKLHEEYSEEVIGGAVENGAIETMVDWSSYFCEYLDFMLPLHRAPGGSVPGNNVGYKRLVVEKHFSLFTSGLWEFFIHAELQKAGIRFRMDPRLIVLHCKTFTVSDFQSQSFHFARSFGAMRGKRVTKAELFKYRFLSPGLPVLVLARLFKKVMLQKKRFRKEFLLSLPWTIWFQLCWCAGETTGYWLGEGNSTARVT